MFDPTVNNWTAEFPEIVIECPLASRVVSFVMATVLLSDRMPSQLNVTRPPPATAARRLGSSQVFTTPAAEASQGVNRNTKPDNRRVLSPRRFIWIPFFLF